MSGRRYDQAFEKWKKPDIMQAGPRVNCTALLKQPSVVLFWKFHFQTKPGKNEHEAGGHNGYCPDCNRTVSFRLSMKKVTVNTYRRDKYYPRVVKAIGEILSRTDVVSPSDILIEMGNLSQQNYEAWR